jgi:hypothetical protein
VVSGSEMRAYSLASTPRCYRRWKGEHNEGLQFSPYSKLSVLVREDLVVGDFTLVHQRKHVA